MAKWYILHTVSGSENSVKKALEGQIKKNDMSDDFEEIIVPVLEVAEIKRGKKVVSEKKGVPGYMFIKMNMTDRSCSLVKSIPQANDFLGGKFAQALPESEVLSVVNRLKRESETASVSQLYSIGDKLRIIDGPFDGFTCAVEEVDSGAQKVKVLVSIFGKATPIELAFAQVKKD